MTQEERAALEAAGFTVELDYDTEPPTPIDGRYECIASMDAIGGYVRVFYDSDFADDAGDCSVQVGADAGLIDDDDSKLVEIPAIKTPAQAIALVKALRGDGA